jgi:hypothetical protein
MIPAPGSDRARKLGCTCPYIPPNEPIRKNLPPDQEWVGKGCPVHDPESTVGDDDA